MARFMGPTWGQSGADMTQVGFCWPHESCYQGGVSDDVYLLTQASFWVWAWPLWDDVILYRRLSLAEPIVNELVFIFWWYSLYDIFSIIFTFRRIYLLKIFAMVSLKLKYPLVLRFVDRPILSIWKNFSASMARKSLGEIAHQLPKLNDTTVGVWEWVSASTHNL